MELHDNRPWSLRNLPLPARLVLALFLIGGGFGYLSALVQLHFAHSKTGTLIPTRKDVRDIYGGGPPVIPLVRLLEAPESEPFNGQGSMKAAFFEKSGNWRRVAALPPAELERTRAEREGERLALLAWIRAGATEESFDQDRWALPEALKGQPLTADYTFEDEGVQFIKVASILGDRCLRCHMEGGVDAQAVKYPLDTYERLAKYLTPISAGFTVERLAQHTHTHLLSLSMFFLLTGLIFALTSYPVWLRVLLAPLVLLAQLVEFACWWLARWQPLAADVIMVSGGVVGVGLALQVLGSLFNMFGWLGRFVLLVLLAGALAGGGWLWVSVIEPHLAAKAAAGG
ncbi:MAG TPA: hypothetical protein PKD86_15940 [Gemmatales bacterium]|nr:hypothetical protein [Gemmatales bacterium]HMP60836.1 hypothetical protein [Gemmatales bacterium]